MSQSKAYNPASTLGCDATPILLSFLADRLQVIEDGLLVAVIVVLVSAFIVVVRRLVSYFSARVTSSK